MRLILKRVLGTPLRFFGFVSLLFAIYFALLFFLDDFIQYYGFIALSFLFSCIVLYTIAYLVKDIHSGKNSFLLLVGSPIKLAAFLCVCYGSIILFFLLLWIRITAMPFILISGGIGLYIIDRIFNKERVGKKRYTAIQIVMICIIIGIFILNSLRMSARTDFIFPKSAQTEAIIVYGIEGYPSLPTTLAWRKTITIPENGLLITSSLIEELPGFKRNYIDENGAPLKINQQYLQDVCKESDILIVVQYFTPKMFYPYVPFNQSDLQRSYQSLYESICRGEVKSKYLDTRLKKYREKPRDELLLEFEENQRH